MKKTYQILNILGFIGVLVMNYLANALPLGGRNTGEISGLYPTLFTPTGLTFAIWGLIYLLLAVFIVLQSRGLFQKDKPTQSFVDAIGPWFFINCLANMAWLLAWHYGYYALSMLFMVSLLVTLILIYVRLEIGRPNPSLSSADKLLIQAPFSLYLGWITVATIANIASVTAYLGWDGFGIDGQVWSAVMMLVAVVVAGALLFNRRNLAYAGVLVWALFGIRAAYTDVTLIANTAVVAAVLITLLALVGYWRTRQPAAPATPQPQTA